MLPGVSAAFVLHPALEVDFLWDAVVPTLSWLVDWVCCVNPATTKDSHQL